MTQTEAMQYLIDRYDCDIHEVPWGVAIYYKNIYALINFEEDKQKWGKGTLWHGSRTEWSTGEFAEHRKLSTEELFNEFDKYLPRRTEITLF